MISTQLSHNVPKNLKDAQNKRPTPIMALPNELQISILHNLTATQLLPVRLVNQQFDDVASTVYAMRWADRAADALADKLVTQSIPLASDANTRSTGKSLTDPDVALIRFAEIGASGPSAAVTISQRGILWQQVGVRARQVTLRDTVVDDGVRWQLLAHMLPNLTGIAGSLPIALPIQSLWANINRLTSGPTWQQRPLGAQVLARDVGLAAACQDVGIHFCPNFPSLARALRDDKDALWMPTPSIMYSEEPKFRAVPLATWALGPALQNLSISLPYPSFICQKPMDDDVLPLLQSFGHLQGTCLAAGLLRASALHCQSISLTYVRVNKDVPAAHAQALSLAFVGGINHVYATLSAPQQYSDADACTALKTVTVGLQYKAGAGVLDGSALQRACDIQAALANWPFSAHIKVVLPQSEPSPREWLQWAPYATAPQEQKKVSNPQPQLAKAWHFEQGKSVLFNATTHFEQSLLTGLSHL